MCRRFIGSVVQSTAQNRATNKSKFGARSFLAEGTFALFCGVNDKNAGKQTYHYNNVNILGKTTKTRKDKVVTRFFVF